MIQNIANFIHGGGFVMYPLLLLLFLSIAVITERFLAFRELSHIPERLLNQTLQFAREGKYNEALKLCENESGPVAACLAAILKHRNDPTREIERLVEETGQNYFIRLERFLPVLDTTTTISPLLGLLGTIIGMIGTFNAIALQQNKGNSDAVLAGVGEALYATATGLSIAIVSFAAYNYFSARLRGITAQTETAATQLINVLVERRHLDHPHEVPREADHR